MLTFPCFVEEPWQAGLAASLLRLRIPGLVMPANVSALAGQPYPESAVAWGATGVYRLHEGDIRILYEVDEQAATVYVINIGIIAY